MGSSKRIKLTMRREKNRSPCRSLSVQIDIPDPSWVERVLDLRMNLSGESLETIW